MTDVSEIVPIRVVASYTTLPDRYGVLRRSLTSMRNQTVSLDAIYLTIPQKASRLNQEYPPLPEDIAAMCTVIRIDTDYGPVTKLYGALMHETDPNTVIISCDDDVIFPSTHVESLMRLHRKFPNIAICGTGALIGRGLPLISIVSTVYPFRPWSGFTGFDVDENGRKVDLIFGVAGVLYVRKFFPPKEDLYSEVFQYSMKEPSIFCNDDVLISGYLSKCGIERRVFFDIPVIKHDNDEAEVKKSALSVDIFKMIGRLNESISKVKEYGFFPTMEEVPLDETPAGRTVFAIILVIIIVVLSVFLAKLL